MDTLKMHSLDGVQRNIELIGKLFPNAITEVKRNGKVEHAIDFDVLRQELSDSIVEGREERYQFTWPDKKKAMLAANAPITATLRPVVTDSVGKDGTPGGFDSENLYIEGDNLEVLKLLQETYLGKVKMIYIDPPYNTGNDFVYEDDFAQRTEDYMGNSGQYDEEGNRMVTNTESNGRFHTDWLNMIYPRLRLAKDLLADDGVIFVSIDDHELSNSLALCNDAFGEQNKIGLFTWLSKSGGGSDNGLVVNDQEYVLCYAKNILSNDIIKKITIAPEPLDQEDEWGKYRVGRELNKWGANSRREDRPTMFFPIHGPNGEDVYPIRNDGSEGCWRWGKSAMENAVQNHNCHFVKRDDGTYIVYEKIRTEESRLKPYRTFIPETGFTSDGTKDVKGLFDEKKVFDFPKPLRLIEFLINLGSREASIVMDFFSGSATTANAVMQLNAEDGGHRKFIMVQLPEKTDEKSEAYKAGYKNICEIGKERIRRAGKQILSAGGQLSMDGVRLDTNSTLNTPNSTLDVGFRCLRLDSSNMENVYYTPEEISQQDMFSLVDNVKPDRTPEDLLFQVMLDLGVLLSSPIEVKEIAGKKVFNVAEGFLLACFDHDVTDETVKAIAQMKPYYAVFRDSSMANDSVATNFDQIFETYSPETVRKVL